MFAIDDDRWPGLGKIAEESGELLQVIGKLVATHGDARYFDGTDLRAAFCAELADLSAAVAFAAGHCLSEDERAGVDRRASEKLALFERWRASPSLPSALPSPPSSAYDGGATGDYPAVAATGDYPAVAATGDYPAVAATGDYPAVAAVDVAAGAAAPAPAPAATADDIGTDETVVSVVSGLLEGTPLLEGAPPLMHLRALPRVALALADSARAAGVAVELLGKYLISLAREVIAAPGSRLAQAKASTIVTHCAQVCRVIDAVSGCASHLQAFVRDPGLLQDLRDVARKMTVAKTRVTSYRDVVARVASTISSSRVLRETSWLTSSWEKLCAEVNEVERLADGVESVILVQLEATSATSRLTPLEVVIPDAVRADAPVFLAYDGGSPQVLVLAASPSSGSPFATVPVAALARWLASDDGRSALDAYARGPVGTPGGPLGAEAWRRATGYESYAAVSRRRG